MSNTSNNKTANSKPTKSKDKDKLRVIVGEIGRDSKTGILGRGYSSDNGKTFHVTDTMYGRLYDPNDIEGIWNGGTADKVKKEVDSATAEIPAAVSAANSAVSAANSAVAASKVNSDAIAAQSKAISEAKAAMDSATAEIQQTAANAASDAAKIRADVAQVQNEVDTAKAANSASVEALKSDVSAAKQDLSDVHDSLTKAQTAAEESHKAIDNSIAQINSDIEQDRKDIASAQQANADTAKQLDTYSKQAQDQGKTIKSIQDKQDGFTATLADVQGNVTQVSDKVDGLSASLKDAQDNVASVKAKADQLSATLTDHAKSIATLTASAKELSSTLEDADGRLSKVEQTAQTNSSTLSDVQGDLSQVKQDATTLGATLKDAQGNISTLQQKADSVSDQLASAQGDIASLQTDVTGIKATLVSNEGDIHTLQADSKTLKDDMQDAQGDISALKKTSTDVTAELQDHAGRISKAEQTAATLTNEFADQQGHLNRVEQKATGTEQTVANQQGQINDIKTDVSSVHETITGQGNQIASINVTLNGLSSKYEGVEKSGNDLAKRLDNLKIGTSNLLHHSDTFDGWYKGASISTATDKYLNGTIATLHSGGSGGNSLEGQLDGPYDDQPVTWTVYAKADNAGDQLHTELWGGGGLTNQPLTTDWKLYKFSGYRNSYDHSFYLWGWQGNKGNVYVALPFAVVGNAIGTWEPNSADISDRITTNSTQITQNQQAIALKADQSTVSNLSGQVSQAQAQLKVQAGQISSKVSSTDFKTLNDKVGNLQAGSQNLIADGDASAYGATVWENTTFRTHPYYYNSTKLMFVIDTSAKTELTADCPNWFPVKAGQQYTLYFNGFMSTNVSSYDVWLLGKKADNQGDWTDSYQIITGERLSPSNNCIVTRTFTVPSSWDNHVAYVRFDNNGSTDGHSAVFFFNEVSLKEGNINTGYSPAPEDSITLIKNNSTAIDQTNQKISLKADQTEVDQVKQTATQNSSRLNVMANEISSKVTSTDVNNIVDGKGYATTSTVQSLISQKAGTINESITNLDAKYSAKDGVNLLRASSFHNVTLDDLRNSGWSLYKAWINKNGGSNKQGSIVIDATSITTGTEDIIQTIPLEPDTDYTLSFHLIYADVASGKSFNAWSYVVEEDSNSRAVSPYVDHNCPMTNSDDRKLNTRTFHTSKNTHQGVLYLRAMPGTKIELEEVKLERGSVATPWTPAPSDNATVTQLQSVTASIDGLKSIVVNKADKSQITQLSNVIQSKVSTADFNSKITQLSNDINLRVTKGDLLGQINVQAGKTLIQNGKIYLDASSIVFGKNSRAIIPSAAIGNLDAAKITTGSISVPMSDGKDNSISFEDDGVVIKSKGKSSDFYDANEGTSKLKITGAGVEFISSTDNDESIKRLGIMTPTTYQNVNTSGMTFVVTGVGDSSSGTLNDRGAFFSLARKTLSYPLDYKGMIYATGEMGDLDTGFHFNDPVYIHPYGAETGIRSTWCSWSSMGNRKFPVLVNSDHGWSGIAFPMQGQAFVFSNNGYVARPNQKVDSYSGYGEGNRDYFDSTDPNQKH